MLVEKSLVLIVFSSVATGIPAGTCGFCLYKAIKMDNKRFYLTIMFVTAILTCYRVLDTLILLYEAPLLRSLNIFLYYLPFLLYTQVLCLRLVTFQTHFAFLSWLPSVLGWSNSIIILLSLCLQLIANFNPTLIPPPVVTIFKVTSPLVQSCSNAAINFIIARAVHQCTIDLNNNNVQYKEASKGLFKFFYISTSITLLGFSCFGIAAFLHDDSWVALLLRGVPKVCLPLHFVWELLYQKHLGKVVKAGDIRNRTSVLLHSATAKLSTRSFKIGHFNQSNLVLGGPSEQNNVESSPKTNL
jgi:hypothetical protein